MHYLCHRSKAVFPADIVDQWGRTRETIGYGPSPVSVALIPNEYAAKAPDGSTPLQVCRGGLTAVEDDHPAVREAFAALQQNGDTFATIELSKRSTGSGWTLHPITKL